jgi:hypothetical protein
MGASRIIGVVAAIALTVVGTTRWRATERPSDWRARFREAALQIPFEKDRPPERDSLVPRDAKLSGPLPRLRIAAARTRDTSRASGIGFRITSDTAYPRLGIAQGVNYVWKDVVGGKTRFLIIPADTAKRAYWLSVRTHAHPVTAATARIVLVMPSTKTGNSSIQTLDAEVCGECADNPLAWCNARDTTRSADFKSAPLAEIARYFARNHVAFQP